MISSGALFSDPLDNVCFWLVNIALVLTSCLLMCPSMCDV